MNMLVALQSQFINWSQNGHGAEKNSLKLSSWVEIHQHNMKIHEIVVQTPKVFLKKFTSKSYNHGHGHADNHE